MDLHLVDWLALLILSGFILDRLAKHMAVWFFFRRVLPPAPAAWPTISLVQPITRSPNDLAAILLTRTRLAYPGDLQQILVYDAADPESLGIIRQVLQMYPNWKPLLLPVAQEDHAIATKSYKMNAGLGQASGEIICFVDDDILLPADGLQVLVRNLLVENVGAVFGLACYTNWGDAWSGLMSAFVNSNALLTYIPFTYFMEPYTVTGHCFALRRQVLEAFGGIQDMQDRLDDDHELARRTRRVGMRLRQTPLVYQVDNCLPSWQAYSTQMKRWFVFPRKMMLPHLSATEKIATMLSSLSILLPGVLAILALFAWRPIPWLSLAACLGVFTLVYGLDEHLFLPARTPLLRWPLVWCSGLLVPFQVLWALFSDDEIEWRGQRMRVLPGGRFRRL